MLRFRPVHIKKVFHRNRGRIASSLGVVLVVLPMLIFWSDIVTFLGIGRAQAAVEYKMQTGYYVGNGGNKEISGLGFAPDMVIVKADDASGVGAFMKTSVMPENATAYLSGAATANDTGNAIELTTDGFKVNAGNTNAINARYTWIAFTGSDCSATGKFCIGSYTGTGGANQSITSVGFQPDLVIVKAATAVAPAWRSSSMANNVGQYFAATAENTTGTLFTTLDATGFTVGTTINTAVIYNYVAFKEAAGTIDVGSYTGDATENRNVTGVGFVPDFLMLKNAASAVGGTVYNVTESYGDSTSYFPDTAVTVDSVQALQADGFQVGTNVIANGNTNTIHYAAFGGASDARATSGSFKMVTGSYVGTGAARTISGLGFSPDLVIIKASTTQAGVFRTKLMAGDTTAYLGLTTADFASGITAFLADGFVVGTAAPVNTANITYYWTAYGNAWNPETNTGSADFTIGAYYVPNVATTTRSITRLPFRPDLVTVKRSGVVGAWRTSAQPGATSTFFHALAEAANVVKTLNTDGFDIGNNASAATVNGQHRFFAFATGTNFSVGTYTGTGVAHTEATSFQPDQVWVKRNAATQGVVRTSAMTSSSSAPFIAASPIVNAITGIISAGFQVGTAAEVNTNGSTYRTAMWRMPSYNQIHYHFRADNDTEVAASSLTAGVPNTPYADVREGVPLRLRLEVYNEGGVTTSPASFRIEYAERGGGTCAQASGWTRVGGVGGAWDMSDSPHVNEADDTTNIAIGSGGVADADATLKTPNGGVRDTSDETGTLTLAPDEFVELEYAMVATAYATDTTTYCFRTTNAGVALPAYTQYPEATFYAHLFATTTGTATPYADVPSTNVYTGGAFVVYDARANDTHAITDITLTEVGTVDASSSLTNIKLRYEYDTAAPYDCVDETYDGTETQFGVTDTDGFSDANGTVSFAGSLTASSTQAVCFYPVMDILENANTGDTIAVQISTTTEDVLASSGDKVRGTDPVRVASSTILRDDALTQTHYHWRNDNGSETIATSVTGGSEDVEYMNMPRNMTKRLRIGVSNEGATSSVSTQYRLEYGEKVGTCSAIGTWTDVGAVGGAFDMHDTTNLIDNNNTTDIPEGDGGVSNENTTFKTPNGGVKDMSSQTSGIILADTEFVELEYAIRALAGATDGTSYCFRVTNAGIPLDVYDVYGESTMTAATFVAATGTQAAIVVSPGIDQYLGGIFVVSDEVASRNVTKVTITETGSIDAGNDLSNIRLYYEMSTTSPYECSDVSYDGTEAQFGAASSSFSGANGSSTFNGSVTISTTSSMCIYVVVDVDASANAGDTVDVEIHDPGTEVAVSAGAVNPNTAVVITGSSTVEKALLSQTHYHWRNDNGNEMGATSKTGGSEDTPVGNLLHSEVVRLRMGVTKGGSSPSTPTVFGLEYGQKVTTCAAVATWAPIETSGGDWVLSDSPNLTNGSDTTNIATSTGGMSDTNAIFKTPNGGVRDASATTSPLTLLATNFLELEYAIEPTDSAGFGDEYCFRLTGNGAPLESYDTYPQATIRTNQDFYIQRGVSTIANTATSVNIVAGVDYAAPQASTSAFIRITNTMSTGAGATSGGGTQNANQVTVSILDPSDIMTDVTLVRSGTVNSTRIYWEIVEYVGPPGGDNEIKVRAAERIAYTTTSLAATTSSVSGVLGDSDVVVFITGQQSPDAGFGNYGAALSTAAWNPGSDTVTVTRGTTGSVATVVSYTVVEFTGVNWNVQRSEHVHGTAGNTETENISPVNDLSRAFLHTQKRVGVNQVDEFGHEVWLSSVGQVSYYIPATAASANTHVHVAWVIENTQTNGNPLMVTRSNGSMSAGGAEPSTYSIPIGRTLPLLSNASLFINMIGLGNTTAHPRAIMGAYIASTTHYELWISDTGSGRSYRTEVVEWPTAVRTYMQNYYRFYVNNNTLTPADPWPPGATNLGENTTITALDTPPTDGTVLRVRMTLQVQGANLSQGTERFKFQYGQRTTPSCSAVTEWHDLGEIGSTTAAWRGYDALPLEGSALSTNPPTGGDLLITSVADRAGTYEEENVSAYNPYKIFRGDDVEYDWVIEEYEALDTTAYCFRMVHEDGTQFDSYINYPTVVTAGFKAEQSSWRWYDDETSLTPTVPLAASNTAPIGIGPGDALKLRILVNEVAGKAGQAVKFKLQFSEFSDFSVVHDVADFDSCGFGSRWCYADGAGTEGATVTASVLEDADPCVGGVGDGCGTHNEYPYVPEVVGEVGTTSVDGGGTLVTLQHTYDDPIYIVEAISGDATGGAGNRPAAAIITATSTSSFTVRVQEPDDEADAHGSETVAYLVMERGAYLLPDGRRVDAGSKTTTRYYGDAVAGSSDDTCAFTQTFGTAPVLLTSLQSNGNTGTPDFLTTSQANVTTDEFACAIEVPDGVNVPPGVAETIGWVAIEAGSFGNNGIALVASTTPQSVAGWTDTPWYDMLWPPDRFTSVPGIVASKQTRNGGDGGWVRYDNEDTDSGQFAMDEADGGNRTHTAEAVGFLVFSHGGVLYRSGQSTTVFGSLLTKEFEFSLQQKDAYAGRTYFFRLYDLSAGLPVSTTTISTHPSVVAESGSLTFTVSGFAAGSSTEGVVADVATTPTGIPFGGLPFGTPVNAVQRLGVHTNASEGYQIFVFERQNLIAGGGQTILDVTGTNAAPTSWASGCATATPSCYGYHTTDNTLAGGSTRFLMYDTYAALTGSLAEIAYSSGPVANETTDVIYRVRANRDQSAGVYESKVVYVAVPVF